MNAGTTRKGSYRVLYASSSPLGALMEVLACFRPDLRVLKGLEKIEDDEGGNVESLGELDASWFSNQCFGVARLERAFCDVGEGASLAHLREALASRALHYGLDDLDAAVIRSPAPRGFTQEISRYVYERSTPQGESCFAGITYLSRLGDDFRNWAIFEPPGGALPWVEEPKTQKIEADNPDLLEALDRLGVRVVGA